MLFEFLANSNEWQLEVLRNTESKKVGSPFICHTPCFTAKMFLEINNQDAAVTQAFLNLFNNYCTISADDSEELIMVQIW